MCFVSSTVKPIKTLMYIFLHHPSFFLLLSLKCGCEEFMNLLLPSSENTQTIATDTNLGLVVQSI